MRRTVRLILAAVNAATEHKTHFFPRAETQRRHLDQTSTDTVGSTWRMRRSPAPALAALRDVGGKPIGITGTTARPRRC